MNLVRGVATDRGRMRDGNEDSYLCEGRLAAVADGMGGHRAGEVASATAMEELRRLNVEQPNVTGAAALAALQAVVERANQRIRSMAAADKSLDGMGTTITAVLEDGDHIHLAHVGDSRAYLFRDGRLTQLTDDHTLVQQLVNEGRLSQEDASRHPQRSIITRALGVDPVVEVDLATYKLKPGDRVLLCTDGLTTPLDESHLRRVLARERDPQRATELLVAMANEAGGPDNVTVIVLDRVASPEPGTDPGTGGLAATDPPTLTGPPLVEPTTPEPPLVRRVPMPPGGRSARHQRGRRPGRGRRRVLLSLATLALLVAAGFGARAWVYSHWFVSFDGEQVAVFQGLPGDIAGLRLHRLVERTAVSREDVPAAYRPTLEEGVSAQNREQARQLALCAPFVLAEGCPPAGGGAATTIPATTTTLATTTTTGARS